MLRNSVKFDAQSRITTEQCCYLCGRPIHLIPFKQGFICDSCLKYVKSI